MAKSIIVLCLAAAAAVVALASATTTSGTLSLDSSFRLDYVADNTANTVAFTATYQGTAWIAIGYSTGTMVGSYAVVGRSGVGVKEMYLGGQTTGQCTVTSSQLISGVSFTQSGGTTVMKFTRTLAPGGSRPTWSLGGNVPIIWAYGVDNTWDTHADRGSTAFTLPAAAGSGSTSSTSGGALLKTGSSALDSSLTLEYKLYTNAIAFTATLSNSAWVGIGFGVTKMFPCYAVVCRSGSTQEVYITGETAAQIAVTGTTLIFNQSVSQTGGKTVMKFARKLNPGSGRATIDPNTAFDMIWAYGDTNTFVEHNHEGKFSVTFATGEFSSSASALLIIHGIVMWLAWGALLPIGALIAGSAWARRKQPTSGPDAWWFSKHRYLQAGGFVLALIGFILGIIMVAVDGGEHADNLHSVAGFVITGLSVVQMIGGWRRIKIGASGRKAWEWFHRILGLSLLIASVVQMMIGVSMKDVTALVIIIGVIGVFWLAAFIYGRLLNGDRPAPPAPVPPQVEVVGAPKGHKV